MPGICSPPPKPLTGKIQTILFTGRSAAEKNIFQVLEAASQIPNNHFLVARDGPLAGVVRETSNRLSNLQFLGWVPSRRLAGVMDRPDALVLLSREEAFGTTPRISAGSLSGPLKTFSGIFEIRKKRFVPLPLVGFKADTLLRATALKRFNAANPAFMPAVRAFRFGSPSTRLTCTTGCPTICTVCCGDPFDPPAAKKPSTGFCGINEELVVDE